MIKIKEVQMEDPEFEDGTTHVAHITFTNPKGQAITYDAVLYLAESGNLAVPIVSSESKQFAVAGGGTSAPIDFSLTMPFLAVSQATFIPCCAISVAGAPIVTFVGATSVIVVFAPAIDWGDIIWD